jgi:hypothetical protein
VAQLPLERHTIASIKVKCRDYRQFMVTWEKPVDMDDDYIRRRLSSFIRRGLRGSESFNASLVCEVGNPREDNLGDKYITVFPKKISEEVLGEDSTSDEESTKSIAEFLRKRK